MTERVFSFLNRWKWWLLIGILLAVGVGWYFMRGNGEEDEVVIIRPEIMDIEQTLEASGTIDAHEYAQLTFPASSRLTWVNVKEGEWAKKWQGVAAVDSRTLQKQMEQDLNLHGKAFRTHEQVLDDNDYYGDSGLTESERRTVESSELDIRNTALAVEIRDIAIQLSSIISPIDGLVTRVDQANVGATVKPTDVFEIVNPNSVFFVVVVDEEDIGLIQNGQSATIQLDAFVEDEFASAVQKIAFSPSVSESGGTGYEVDLSLPVDNQMLKYKLGMNGDANIILSKKANVLAVPVDSIIEREGVAYVEVQEGEEAVRREVETGISNDDYVEIVSGLTQEDLVLKPSNGE